MVSGGSQQNDRIVMVLVYPDATTAQAEAGGSDQLTGRRLVPGYGPAQVWRKVVLVESSRPSTRNSSIRSTRASEPY
jgi:hypothetical protein